MIKEEINTEQKILAAAEEVFLQEGFSGARMQLIADKAAINKAMLHYYFRSKDALFEKVFDENSKKFFPEMIEILDTNLPFSEKVESFIDRYIDMLLAKPFLPLFVMNTINQKGKDDFIQKLPLELPQKLMSSYFVDQSKGLVREINPMQFMLSIMGMCVFPFLAKPMISKAFNMVDEDFKALMLQRKLELKTYTKLILTVEK
ncbi:DNA-binding transcriptional regulator, AcrR family [Spirosomataceae bacterium TFI 002]|nr:DNA-binding transcriptional regulator, AcrR family [Spirosomataceae bacterium TFI 002]